MPLKLPELDDRRWTDLVQEAIEQIPGYGRAWTNYNPADPGVTLVELFAFLTESLIYRVDQVTDANVYAFLRLINGPDWKPGQSLLTDQRSTLENLRRPVRAVTPSDYEELTFAVNQLPGEPQLAIARVKAIPNRNLESGKPGAQMEAAPGHVSIVIVSARHPNTTGAAAFTPSAELIDKVRAALEPARLLTTVVHVVPPRFITFGVRLAITVPRGAHAETTRRNVLRVLSEFFDPLTGGPDHNGWPFGRSIYLSDVYQVARSVAGVLAVSRVFHRETKHYESELVVPAHERKRMVRNEAHETEAIELRPDELPLLEIHEEDLSVSEESGKL